MNGENGDDAKIVSYHQFFWEHDDGTKIKEEKQKNRKWKSGRNQRFFWKINFVVVIGVIVLFVF